MVYNKQILLFKKKNKQTNSLYIYIFKENRSPRIKTESDDRSKVWQYNLYSKTEVIYNRKR